MTFYFDASALVKAYKAEKGTAKVVQLLTSQEQFFSSRVCYAEVLFALRRAREALEISEQDFWRKVGEFESHWDTCDIVQLSDPVGRILKDSVLKYSLRALDAIHLASALWLKQFFNLDVTFICADDRLLAAASEEQLSILNPEEAD